MVQKGQTGGGLHKREKLPRGSQGGHTWSHSPKPSGHRICPAEASAIRRMRPMTSEPKLNAKAPAITAMAWEGRSEFRGASWEFIQNTRLTFPWPKCMATFSFDGCEQAVIQLDGKEIRKMGVLILRKRGKCPLRSNYEFLLHIIITSYHVKHFH